jgi:hypothetical protein
MLGLHPAENVALLILALLVSRQRAMSMGEAQTPVLTLLREPREFFFHWRGGQLRAELARADLGMLHSSILVVEEGRFVAPLASLQPHLRIGDAGADLVNASFSPAFTALAGVQDPDEVYAVYSPLHLAYAAECGFFLPRREPWHAYLCRALAARLGAGALQIDDSAEGVRAAFGSDDTRITLRLNDRGFELQAHGPPAGSLLASLLDFCGQQPLPAGVSAHRLGEGAVRITGGT